LLVSAVPAEVPAEKFRRNHPDQTRPNQPRRETGVRLAKNDPSELNGADLDLCWDCRSRPPVGGQAKGWDDVSLCRACNDARALDLADEERA
jgi:hypothetical protein